MKYAFLYGCNYINTNNQLPDCQLDVDNIEKKLTDYKTEKHYIGSPQLLLDFISHINQVVKPNDTVLIHYSGHGTQINSNLEKDGIIEALVFFDKGQYYLLRDKDFVKLTDSIKCKVIIILDSCFSGGMDYFIGTDKIIRSIKVKGDLFEVNLPISKSLTKKINLLASAETETSVSTGKGGLFTNSILDCIKNKKQTVNQIYKFSIDYCKGEQTPQLKLVGMGKTTKLF